MKRRFCITWQEGEIIILALTALITSLENDIEFSDSPYWNYQKEAAKRMRERLTTYNWERESK